MNRSGLTCQATKSNRQWVLTLSAKPICIHRSLLIIIKSHLLPPEKVLPTLAHRAWRQLPRLFTAQFVATVEDGISKVEVFVDGERCGAKLNDNSYVSDGYRFHDIFHMTCAALLGWSPVIRALMKRKRKSDKETDEVEDGGRAIVTDEALAAVVFSYAVRHTYLDEIKVLDWQLLDLCHDLAEPFEVGKRSRYEWEQTILKTFEIWRKVQNHSGGWVRFDRKSRVVEFSIEKSVL
jgi:hypothetical protein